MSENVSENALGTSLLAAGTVLLLAQPLSQSKQALLLAGAITGFFVSAALRNSSVRHTPQQLKPVLAFHNPLPQQSAPRGKLHSVR